MTPIIGALIGEQVPGDTEPSAFGQCAKQPILHIVSNVSRIAILHGFGPFPVYAQGELDAAGGKPVKHAGVWRGRPGEWLHRAIVRSSLRRQCLADGAAHRDRRHVQLHRVVFVRAGLGRGRGGGKRSHRVRQRHRLRFGPTALATTRQQRRSGSMSTAPTASANSPALRQSLQKPKRARLLAGGRGSRSPWTCVLSCPPRVGVALGGVCSRALAGGSGLVYRDTALDDEEAVMNGSKRRHVLTDRGHGVTGAVRALRAGDLGPVDILEECLERIEASEPEVGAWVEIDAENAKRTAARQAALSREEARGAAFARNPHRGQGHHRRRRAADAGRVCLARRPSCGMRRPDREEPPRPRRNHPRQDRDHPVRVPGSGAHPQSLEPRTLSRRVERGQRGGGRERDVPGRARHPDRRVDRAPPRASAGSRVSRAHGARGRSKASCR